MEFKRIKIVYYTGTGSTDMAMNCFYNELIQEGYDVSAERLFKENRIERIDPNDQHTLLLLLFPVYAFNAPSAVYKWLDQIELVEQIPAVVVSVSGGGEVSPNTACRTGAIRRLKRKGFHVIYEQMLIMPSNWIVATQEPLARMLLDILPQKVKKIVVDLNNGSVRKTKSTVMDRLLSKVGILEHYGALLFGKLIKTSDACAECGWCSRNCPSDNIKMNNGKPSFGYKCHLCLSCIYGCPQKALSPGFAKFVTVKGGYNLKSLQEMGSPEASVDVESLAKGYAWSGIRKYLKP